MCHQDPEVLIVTNLFNNGRVLEKIIEELQFISLFFGRVGRASCYNSFDDGDEVGSANRKKGGAVRNEQRPC